MGKTLMLVTTDEWMAVQRVSQDARNLQDWAGLAGKAGANAK
jgi:hypothetical protein